MAQATAETVPATAPAMARVTADDVVDPMEGPARSLHPQKSIHYFEKGEVEKIFS
ncbi:hypothetical protein DSCA_52450 [Desulfosarcina alkanivorans]|jgi:hypothetical protein|uniref:Uncharacterized protein n=1 Tax=Desulfosarcina alkanivorans TaxID=571177 RepID=A0A5K7YSE2_9BACT|nr:hypothetical protein DSCA_52450 [Desulfosarcina alkanivorans]